MKISGSWASLLRGVSQQPPESRQSGQHGEQVNLLSDPVAGLTRRRGTVMKAVAPITTPAAQLAAIAAAGGYRKLEHSTEGKQYVVLIREDYHDLTYGLEGANLPPSVICYSITDNLFVPLADDVSTQARATLLGRQGVAAAASVGKYIVHALKGEELVASSTAKWGPATNVPVIWVRGGAYDRRYKVDVVGGASFYYDTPTVYTGGAVLKPTVLAGIITEVVVEVGGYGYKDGTPLVFTGPSATLAVGHIEVTDGVITGTVLDAGGTGYATPDVSVAILPAGALLSPQSIAEGLRVAAVAAGYTATRNSAHLYLSGVTSDVSSTDGGDGTLLRAVASTTDSVDKLPIIGYSGQVVQIQTGPDDAFYVEAITRDTAAGAFSEVIWRECAGTVQTLGGIGLMLVEGGTLRLGTSATLTSSAPVPQFVPSGAGDESNNPKPAFLRGVPITYMGLFQDRLIVCAGAATAVSAAGDYFNFFRSSVVTVPLKDPFEMIAQGGEDDYIRFSVAYNRNLVLFGDRRQYLISGTTALTPTSANMSIMTTYADAADTAPVAAGGQIYYARNREGNVGVHQIQPGSFVDSAESFPASAQIGDYIAAPAAQLEIVPGAPSLLLVRSAGVTNGLATFSFLDTPDGRKQDAWSKWEFATECGQLLACKSTPNGVLLFWLRQASGRWWIVCDILPLATEAGPLPFLDSLRPVAYVTAGAQDVTLASTGWYVAMDKTTDRYLIGTPLEDRAELSAEYPSEYASAWVGCAFQSYVELTNPFIKDGSDKPVLEGRLVITKMTLNIKNSGGCVATVTSGGADKVYKFNARVLGSLLNTIGRVPVDSAYHTVAVGRETREYKVRLAALKWFPFTLVGIGWTGQSFNRTARA